MTEDVSVGVVITCHNRREMTLSALASLERTLPEIVSWTAYLVDDGSSDGTSSAVQQMFPRAVVIQGDGNLFWCRGMALGENYALADDHDFVLWLNDDVTLQEGWWSRFYETAVEYELAALVCGSIVDSNGVRTYGGLGVIHGKAMTFEPLGVSEVAQVADTMQGNVVLVPRFVSHRVGRLDRRFAHSFGDIDYGLRTTRMGLKVVVAPGITGHCEGNPFTPAAAGLPLREKLQAMMSKKAQPPRSRWIFLWRHFRVRAIFIFPLPYLRVIQSHLNEKIGSWRKSSESSVT